jgi:hypothetical protein
MHVVLGRAMQTLHDNAVLKGSILQGGLKSSNCEFRITRNPISFEELTKILTAFPDNTQKVSAAYIVSPVFIDSTNHQLSQGLIQLKKSMAASRRMIMKTAQGKRLCREHYKKAFGSYKPH